MFLINKITSNNVVDFAAEELKKYLRMMMPECGEISINYAPDAKDGFRLGLMQDFGLDVSDAEDVFLDDIFYIDCDEHGGIIAGSNPRSVLISVYEYLKQNGCRWLLPGVEGEYIPIHDIKSIKYRHKPTLRYRGWCSEGALFQDAVYNSVDITPKMGMNCYYIQFINPHRFYNNFYNHKENAENREPEGISIDQTLQWKRLTEAELSKRGIQFHDMGHGFSHLPFDIFLDENGVEEKPLTDEQKQFMALLGGERGVHGGSPVNTNFCMSNKAARDKVSDYIVEYAKNHKNVDFIGVSLADGTNNHCECDECKKKTPSDWYVMLLNEADEKLTKAGLKTKLAFSMYVDTMWAPKEEKIKNPERFLFSIAPIFRSYAFSVEKNRQKTELVPFKHNKNEFPRSLGASLDYMDEWKRRAWKGDTYSFEYYFWRHQAYDLTGRMLAKLINDDIKGYEANDVQGVITCGSQRSFFPSGLAFYSYARTLYDTSLTYEEIEEEYMSALYGEEWTKVRDYFEKIFDALPFEFFSRDVASNRPNVHYDPERAEKIAGIRDITKQGRELIKSMDKNDCRVRKVALNLLMFHADFCDYIADWMSAKARGKIDRAMELLELARIELGKQEMAFDKYYDHRVFFSEYIWTQRCASPKVEDIVEV